MPDLPKNAEFTQILVNRSGSLAAMIGRRMIFIVEMDQDFWSHYHAFDSDSVEHLRPEYFARCSVSVNRKMSCIKLFSVLDVISCT